MLVSPAVAPPVFLPVPEMLKGSRLPLVVRRCRLSRANKRWASTSAEHSDVVIVGGGPAGLALAAALGALYIDS